MKKVICKHCKQEIKKYPQEIKSYSQWLSTTTSDKSLKKYRWYVERMKNKYGIEQIPDVEEMLKTVLQENKQLKERIKQCETDLMKSYNFCSSLMKYEIFYKKFEQFIKQKVAIKLDLPITNITQALFNLELKSLLIKQKFNLNENTKPTD